MLGGQTKIIDSADKRPPAERENATKPDVISGADAK
jgi:hypothetical protein